MHAVLTAFSRHLAAETRAPRTIGTYNAIIAAFFAFWRHEPGSSPTPTRTDVEAFLGRGRQDGAPRAPATRNQELATLRVFAAFARRDLGWSSDPTQGVPFVREPPRIPAVLSAEELQRSFRTVATVLDPEDRACNLAILALLSQTGLRVHELVQLDVDQVDLTTATLLRVEGKGGTARELPLNDRALALVSDWIKERPKWAAAEERALVVSSRGRRISARTVERRIEQLRRTMQLTKKATPHSFRHTFATLELMVGTDLATLAELLGHTDINTTARYLHWIDTRRREAVRKLAYTVPVEVLPSPPPSETAVPIPPEEPLLAPIETPAVPREIELDDEHSFVAKSTAKVAHSATNMNAPLDGGALTFGGAEGSAFDTRGGPMFHLIPLLVLALLCGACSNELPTSNVDGGSAIDAANDGVAMTFRCPAGTDCDDHVPCTDDLCLMTATGVRQCRHVPNLTMCGTGETCDPRRGCSTGYRCMSDSDCARQFNQQCLAELHCDSTAHVCVAERLSCDDGVACTVDDCIEDRREGDQYITGGCMHIQTLARCAAGQTCHPIRSCIPGQVCASDRDCVDTDPCTTHEHCDMGARVCLYDLLDGDGDRVPASSCGGTDCNDNNPSVRPGVPELCNGTDDNCDGRTDETPNGCGRGSTCQSGMCTCTQPVVQGQLQRCYSPGNNTWFCADVRSDDQACGGCTACPMGSHCVMGRCN